MILYSFRVEYLYQIPNVYLQKKGLIISATPSWDLAPALLYVSDAATTDVW